MHPHNPFAPTMHFNYRYFETEEWNGVPGQWWFGASGFCFMLFFEFFLSLLAASILISSLLLLHSLLIPGGGTDITPAYVDEDDMRHFHGTYKNVCDRHDPSYYGKFKKWADEYFWCKHREQTRGLGGIFFDDLNDRPKEEIVKFSAECLASVVPAYVPIVHKHKDDAFTTKQKEWQAMRRVRGERREEEEKVFIFFRVFLFLFPFPFLSRGRKTSKRSSIESSFRHLPLLFIISLSFSLIPNPKKRNLPQKKKQGLYAEYNLVYDRGTTFGLKTAGRVESILMSLPLSARWEDCHKVEEGSPEATLLAATRTPREWV